MRQNASFTIAAILALALGIGATTAIFSVVNGVILRSLALPGFRSPRPALGAAPALGRSFLASMKPFSPTVIGRKLVLYDEPYSIVGVLPATCTP